MKADTKIILTMPFWLPGFIIGVIVGLICEGFRAGFGIMELLSRWFDEANVK